MRRSGRGGGGVPRVCRRCFSTSSIAPERILIIGGGISGLSTAYFLQHLRPSSNHPRPLIHLVDSSPRLGGWIRTNRIPVPSPRSPPLDLLFEGGPRSLLTRRGDSTLALLQSLGLQDRLLLSDETAKRRFLWNGHLRRLVMLPTGLNASLLSFPLLSPLLAAVWNELRQPRRTSSSPTALAAADESIFDFVSRRFSRVVAEELFDPLVAGIYSGDVRQLSVASCFASLSSAETQHGGVLRGMFRSRRSQPFLAEEKMEGEAELGEMDWVKRVKANGTYSFKEGMETLPRALVEAITAQAKATSSHVGSRPIVRTSTTVDRLTFGAEGVTASVNGEPEQYDRVISSCSSVTLGRILQRSYMETHDPPEILAPGDSAPVTEGGLQLLTGSSALAGNELLPSLASSLLSLPHASVWVVNVAYDAAVLPHAGFGVLCSSLHSSDILGIAFDSCCFPGQPPFPSAQPVTRLTVMLGGARFPQVTRETWEQAVERALAGIGRMLGCARPPVYLGGGLMRDCIPQYVVGHGGWVKGVEEGVAEVNRRVGGQRLQVIGTALHGVAVNDLIKRAKRTATDTLHS